MLNLAEWVSKAALQKAEGAMYACKVQLVCSACGKPTRVAHKISEDGKKARICKNAVQRCKEDKTWLDLRFLQARRCSCIVEKILL